MKVIKVIAAIAAGGVVIYIVIKATEAMAGNNMTRSGVILNPGVRGTSEAASFGRVSPTLANTWNAPSDAFNNAARTLDVIQDSRNAVEYTEGNSSSVFGAISGSYAFGAPPRR